MNELKKPEELLAEINVVRKWTNKLHGICLVLFFAGLIGNIYLAEYLQSNFHGYQWLSGVFLISIILGCIISIRIINRKTIERLPSCNNCKEPITPLIAKIVIASKNCTNCGKQIIQD